MKKTALIIAFLSVLSISAQDKRNVGNFTKISVRGSFEVNLVSGSGAIKISNASSDVLSHILTEVKANRLEIYFDKSYKSKYPTKSIVIDVPFSKLDDVVLTGSGDIKSDVAINSENLNVQLTGSGDIELNVNATNIMATLNGSGDLELKGKTTHFKGELTGSGDLKAFDLKAENTDITVNGSGEAKVNASENLLARVHGSGSIDYSGNPKKEDTKISGSGSIEKK